MAELTLRAESIDLLLPGGRSTLRVTLSRDAEGAPVSLVLAVGIGGRGESFTRPSWGPEPLVLPAAVLPDLLEAVAALRAETP